LQPDGNVDGFGFDDTGHQTLRRLYTGVIPSITSQPGTSTFTLDTLKQALAEIVNARNPEIVKTQDYVIDYASPDDHPDHMTTARITTEVVSAYASSVPLLG
jgi:LmbE family N-acetylglucosaminyl deacetylase